MKLRLLGGHLWFYTSDLWMHKSSTICGFYLVSPLMISQVSVMSIYHVKSSMPSNAFKLFKEEVENQLDRKTKVVRYKYNRGSGYYDKYDELGHAVKPQAHLLDS